MSGSIEHYQSIGTMHNLQELTLVFGNEPGHPDFSTPVPPLLLPGAFSGLSRLEIITRGDLDREAAFGQVNASSCKIILISRGNVLS